MPNEETLWFVLLGSFGGDAEWTRGPVGTYDEFGNFDTFGTRYRYNYSMTDEDSTQLGVVAADSEEDSTTQEDSIT